jgi:hypothetical protein
MLKYLGMITQCSGETGVQGGSGMFVFVKKYINCMELWADEDFEMLAIEVKGRDTKVTREIVSVYRAANEDMRVLESLAAQTGYAGNSTMRSLIGCDLNYPVQIGMEMRFVILGLVCL